MYIIGEIDTWNDFWDKTEPLPCLVTRMAIAHVIQSFEYLLFIKIEKMRHNV